MGTQKRAMGNGVQSLFQGSGYINKNPQNINEREDSLISILPIDRIEANSDQPRKSFPEESIKDLSFSIKKHGVLQPIIVINHPNKNNFYQIVAGERRFRAAQIAGLSEIPTIIRSFSQKEIAIVSLLENIQREDLNVIEEANALFLLKEEFGVTQEEMAKELGRSRSVIANTLRLLQLSKNVQNALSLGEITQGHAIILLRVNDENEQAKLCEKIIQKGYSVKETTLMIDAFINSNEKKAKNHKEYSDAVESVKNVLFEFFEMPVHIVGSENKGKINISFNSKAELETIVSKLKG